MQNILFGIVILLFLLLIYVYKNNRKLSQEIKVLKQILELKETTVSNLQTSRVSVKDVIDHFSSHDEVMNLINAGESRESISKKLGIGMNKIELIIKFNKIKKDKQNY